MQNPSKPCAECPFSPRCVPGALGSSDPRVYIGQAFGPFFLPCHSHTNYQDPGWKQDVSKPQCAGAAIFRANQGVGVPGGLHKLPPGDLAFQGPEELLMHHLESSREEAQWILEQTPPKELLKLELSKKEVCFHQLPASN